MKRPSLVTKKMLTKKKKFVGWAKDSISPTF